jgi:2-polyprenyl-3-methyl-5-hydroxy-6-metoxy-1,4-benzoquinol methylase
MTQPFWNKTADKYAAQPIADQAAYERKLATTRSHLRPDMRVLEFACGTGTTALTHAPHVRSIRAIDYSARMIEIARGKAEAAGIANVAFEVGAIEDLAETDGPYDVVLGMSILHLLPDRHAVLRKVFQLLPPGGRFFSSTVCVGDLNPLVGGVVLPVMKVFGAAPTVARFTADELVADMAAAGFAVDEHWRPARDKAVFVVAQKP